LEEAVDGFQALGDRVAAGRAMGILSSVLNTSGSQRHANVAAEAVGLLEAGGAGPDDLVAAYARMAGVMLVVGDMRETIAWADRASALGAGHGLEVPARALGFRGSARCALGDPAGLEELRAALALALERGEGRDAAMLFNNLGDALLPVEGPASVLATYRQGIEFARRRGISEFAVAMAAASLDRLIEVGRWDQALADAEAMAGRAEAEGNVSDLLQLRTAQVRVLVGRGQTGRAGPIAAWLVEAARESGGSEDVVVAFTAAAGGLLATGEPARALSLLAEARDRLAEAAARHGEAADRWGSFGVVPERAHALLGRGRCLVALGRPGAGEPLRQARQVFAGLRAQPLAAEADALLGRAGTRA
jgi:hypothetical protein